MDINTQTAVAQTETTELKNFIGDELAYIKKQIENLSSQLEHFRDKPEIFAQLTLSVSTLLERYMKFSLGLQAIDLVDGKRLNVIYEDAIATIHGVAAGSGREYNQNQQKDVIEGVKHIVCRINHTTILTQESIRAIFSNLDITGKHADLRDYFAK